MVVVMKRLMMVDDRECGVGESNDVGCCVM